MKITAKQTQIIVAAIAALGGIISTLIMTCNVKTIEVKLIDIQTKKGISGNVFIDADEDGKPSYPESPAVLKIKRENRFIRAESDGYEPKIVSVKDVVSSRNIEMKKIAAAAVAMPVPLSFAGWETWDLHITTGANDNEIIINGRLDDAGGFFNSRLPAILRGRTLVLYFSNVGRSEFSLNRMAKLTYNRSDTTLEPVNESTRNGGYIPASETPLDRGIEYQIPNDFDGKLGFVFFQANLRDLRIKAFYR